MKKSLSRHVFWSWRKRYLSIMTSAANNDKSSSFQSLICQWLATDLRQAFHAFTSLEMIFWVYSTCTPLILLSLLKQHLFFSKINSFLSLFWAEILIFFMLSFTAGKISISKALPGRGRGVPGRLSEILKCLVSAFCQRFTSLLEIDRHTFATFC